MPFDRATLDAIKAAAPPGSLMLRPLQDDGSLPASLRIGRFSAEWQGPVGTPSHTAPGDTEAEALDNLLLNLEGKLDRAIRLRAAQAREHEAQARYDAARAEREAIEKDTGQLVVADR